MRVLLFTGKGGVGTSTTAAAAAVHAAAGGHKTLLLAVGGALIDVVGVPCNSQPTEIAANLYAAQVDPQLALQSTWHDIAIYAGAAFDSAEPLDEAELAVLPAVHEWLALFELQSQATAGRWEVIVVDCGPSPAAVRLLSLPQTLTWYLERLFSLPRKGLPMPSGPEADTAVLPARARAYAAATALHARSRLMRGLLADSSTTARLVVSAQTAAVNEARRAYTALTLHGLRVDGVIINPLADRGTTDHEDKQLARIESTFSGVRISRGIRLPGEPIGVPALAEFATGAYHDHDLLAVGGGDPHVRVDRDGPSFVLSLALPLVERDEIDLVRRGDELVVTVHGQRRVLTLPSALRRCSVTGAALADERLAVTFVPEPHLWLRT